MGGKILIIDTDKALAQTVFDTLILADYKARLAHNVEEALASIRDLNIHLLICSIALLDTLKNVDPELPVLLITEYGAVSEAVSAIRNGADDYLLKPIQRDELLSKVKRLLKTRQAHNPQEFIAVDESSLTLLKMAKKVAATDATVLISGESGTGKEVLSQYIHQNSSRYRGPFIAVNCAAIPETMLEATLFGYEKGAFTGAVQAHEGKFEQANGGTLLLDEISEMDLGLQAKLLRVLQEREVERIGSKKLLRVDVRIIATTNRDLKQEAQAGRFREDLFYRLHVFPLRWLPLRERKRDILPVAQYLLRKHASEMSLPLPTFTPSAEALLTAYHWPGNIREMDNIMQRMVILSGGGTIDTEDLPLEVERESVLIDTPNQLKSREYQLIFDELQRHNGNRLKVSEVLGISPRTLRYKIAKMKELGMDVPPSIRV